MKIFAALFWLGVVLGACAGCTTLTEYEIADREVLRLESFYRYEESCGSAGGRVEITRRSWTPRHCSWKQCPPNKGDSVRCTT